jgi:hypothetical protein
MNKPSVSEIIDIWGTHGLQNLHEINLDRIYAFPPTRQDVDPQDTGIQWIYVSQWVNHFPGTSRQGVS